MMQQLKAVLTSGRFVFAFLTLVLLVLMIEPTQGQGDYRVGLVVRHGNGEVVTQCVDIGAPTVSGYDVLVASGLDMSLEAQSMGTVICSIDGEGCSFPQESCFCQCMSSPCTYWSYWQRQNERWVYSNLGASGTTVQAGSVEGWSWGAGTINTDADHPPPDVSYLEICEPQQATATAVARITLDAAAAASATAQQATPTPAPAATATPTINSGEPPLITYLTADRERIQAGESIALTWETRGAASVVLESGGTEQSVALSGSLTLTPEITTNYRLIARNGAGEDRIEVMITVDLPAPTVTPTTTPTPGQTATATPTVEPPPAPTQTDATGPPVDAPIIPPAATLAPSATPTEQLKVIVIDTATSTPVLLATLTPTPTSTVPPTNTSIATPTAAAIALAQSSADQAGGQALSSVPDAGAGDLAGERIDQTSGSEPALDVLRGPFGAMLFVVAAPLALAAMALLALRLRKRADP